MSNIMIRHYKCYGQSKSRGKQARVNSGERTEYDIELSLSWKVSLNKDLKEGLAQKYEKPEQRPLVRMFQA